MSGKKRNPKGPSKAGSKPPSQGKKKKGGNPSLRKPKKEWNSFRSNVAKTVHDGFSFNEDQWPSLEEVTDLLKMVQMTLRKRGVESITLSPEDLVINRTAEGLAAEAAAKAKKFRDNAVLRALNSKFGTQFSSLKRAREVYTISGAAFQPQHEVTAEAVAQWVQEKNVDNAPQPAEGHGDDDEKQ